MGRRQFAAIGDLFSKDPLVVQGAVCPSQAGPVSPEKRNGTKIQLPLNSEVSGEVLVPSLNYSSLTFSNSIPRNRMRAFTAQTIRSQKVSETQFAYAAPGFPLQRRVTNKHWRNTWSCCLQASPTIASSRSVLSTLESPWLSKTPLAATWEPLRGDWACCNPFACKVGALLRSQSLGSHGSPPRRHIGRITASPSRRGRREPVLCKSGAWKRNSKTRQSAIHALLSWLLAILATGHHS